MVVLLLLEHGADPDIASIPQPNTHQELSQPFQAPPQDDGSEEPKTPLDYALEARNVHVATYLYLAGAFSSNGIDLVSSFLLRCAS